MASMPHRYERAGIDAILNLIYGEPTKQEPPKPKELWIVKTLDGNNIVCYDQKRAYELTAAANGTITHYIAQEEKK